MAYGYHYRWDRRRIPIGPDDVAVLCDHKVIDLCLV